jgi:hypothetical protein
VRKKIPELWKKKSWILNQGHAPVHDVLTMKQSLTDKCIPVVKHPPYSLYLAPCDFSLFPKEKTTLRRIHFQSVDDVKTKMTGLLNRA